LTKLRWIGVVALGLAAFAGLLASWVEAEGVRFLEAGTSIVSVLDEVARRTSSAESILPLLADDYSSPPLAVASSIPENKRDGIRNYELATQGGVVSREEFAEQWSRYYRSFHESEEVSFDMHRLEIWEGTVWSAILRFEIVARSREGDERTVDQMMLRAGLLAGESPKLLSLELIEGRRIVGSETHFSDVAAAAGVGFLSHVTPGFDEYRQQFDVFRYAPAGITTTDVDGDGFYDLYIPDGLEPKLFRNSRDGSFEDITEASGLGDLGGAQVALFADYDNDGDRDLFVARMFLPDQLFRNRGDGTFEDVSDHADFDAVCCTAVAAWADYDLDGDLDLYLGRYLDPRTDSPGGFYARNGNPNQLFRNDDGRFVDVTDQAGVGEIGLCLGVVFGDYDDDGDPDLYVANDFGRNALYRNRGDGTFEETTVESGTLAYGAGMSATFGDYDNDGRLDLYVANIRSKYMWFTEPPMIRRFVLHSILDGVWLQDTPLYLEIMREWPGTFVEAFEQMASGNTLLRNHGDGTFEDRTWESGTNPPGWYWGSVLADLDNDGWQDIYVANGWIYGAQGTELEVEFLTAVVAEQDLVKSGAVFDPQRFGNRSWHGYERNRQLRNRGDGTFEQIGFAAGTDLVRNSRGVAVADFWNRGVLDIAVAAHRDRHALLRNDIALKRNWLQVELRGVESNRDAVGARITIEVGDQQQMRELVLGDGYASQSSLRQHFGLGEAIEVDRLEVRWPKSGRTQTFEAIAANQIIEIVEGESVWTRKQYAPASSAAGILRRVQRETNPIAR